MRKNIILVVFLLLLFTPTINAKGILEVICDKSELNLNTESECKIVANNLDFIITGISVKLKMSSNISITSSEYNVEKWAMLDDKFDIKEINLINEKPIREDSVEIASFKIKANDGKKSEENITLEDILIGDQNYEKRQIDVKNEVIYLNPQNISSKDYIIYAILILIGLMTIFCVVKSKKKLVEVHYE